MGDSAICRVENIQKRKNSESDGGLPGEYRSELVLLDELSHATSDVSRDDQAKMALDHYNLFTNLSNELSNLGEWGVYVGRQVNAKKAEAHTALIAAYAKETGKKAEEVNSQEAINHYQKKYEKK